MNNVQNTAIKIDDIDRQILGILQENAKTTNATIARKITMAPSGVLERIKRLEQTKIILGYETRINPKAFDIGLISFIFIKTDEKLGCTEIGEKIADIEQVQEIHYVSGEFCYLLKVRVANTDALSDLLEKIGAISGVISSETILVFKSVKESISLPINNNHKEDQNEPGSK